MTKIAPAARLVAAQWGCSRHLAALLDAAVDASSALAAACQRWNLRLGV